jgi:hypothetical protein
MMPAYVEVNIEGSPAWLTVVASPKTFVLDPETTKRVSITMKVNQNDINAGQSGTIDIALTGRLVTGGLFRTLDRATLQILAGYNPFTEITISSVRPIARTAPDKELPFVVDVYNYGNSNVIVDFSLDKEPEKWDYVISPASVVIPPKAAGDETFPYETVRVTLTSPHGGVISYHNDWENFVVLAKARSEAPYYEYSGGKWQETTEQIVQKTYYEARGFFLAKNRGFYVPGFDVLFLLAGLAVAGVLVARKRKR